MNETLKKQILYTLQLLMSVYVALEIAIPPNPHIKHIIIVATIIIVLKHNIVENILETYERLVKKLFK
jgi:hypothetical protein|tara:strand:+ start:85 stop:288 length:204 start_codon:yes stop_codon:yes gene_type:complete